MLRKNAVIRFSTSSIGLLFQIASIFLLTKLLDIYQFALWGVATSFIYIFAAVGNLGYENNIEKYFPNLSNEKKIIYIFKYFKTVAYTLPFWILVLVLFEKLNYFEKFNADNIIIFFFIISCIAVVEVLVNLLNVYFVSKNNNSVFDINELIFFKIPKLIFFYVLLINNYSLYYLFLCILILRFIFLIRLLILDSKGVYNPLKVFIKSNIFEDNFLNFKYNLTSYFDNILYVSFLNFIFLVSVNFFENIAISHFTLAILIINNLRPVIDTLPSVMTGIISKGVKNNESLENLRAFSFYVNSIIVGFVVPIAYVLTKNEILFSLFLSDDFERGVSKIIFLSIISSSIHTFYFPNYHELLFSGKEKVLLKFNIGNYITSTFLYLTLALLFLDNFIYIYIFYEMIYFCFVFFSQYNFKEFFKLFKLSTSSYYAVFLIILYFTNIGNNLFVLVSIPFLLFDLKKLYEKLLKFNYFNN
tara:strand:+ start:855 stop:2273 length:1419 start_codon:yes stop_codon:yes gene_type:complete